MGFDALARPTGTPGLLSRATAWLGRRAEEALGDALARAGLPRVRVESLGLGRARLRLGKLVVPLGERRVAIDEIDVGLVPAAPLGAFAFDGVVRAGGVPFAVRGRLALEGGKVQVHALRVRAARVPLLALDAIVGPDARPRSLPEDARFDVALERARDGALRGTIVATTEGSSVELTLERRATGELDGSRLAGRVSFENALEMGWFPGDLAPRPTGELALDLALRGSLAEVSARGTIGSARVLLGRASQPSASPLELVGGRVTIAIDRRRLAYRDLEVLVDGVRVRARGQLAFGARRARGKPTTLSAPRAVIEVADAAPPWIERVAAFVGAPLPEGVRLPDTLRARGEVVFFGGGVTSATIVAGTARSRVEAVLAPGGDFAASTARGELDLAEVVELLGARFAGLDTLAGRATIDASLERRGGELEARFRVGSESLSVRGEAVGGELALTDVLAEIQASRSLVRFQLERARLLGGLVTARGALDRTTDAILPIDATVTVRGLRVEQVGALAKRASGALSGEVHLRRASAASAIEARVSLALEEPDYRFLRELEPRLLAVGLPPIAARGPAPSRLDARWDGRALTIDRLELPLRGVQIEARGRAVPRGELAGEATIRLSRAYLARSVFFLVSAVAPTIAIPLVLAGSTARPRFEVRASSAFEDTWDVARASALAALRRAVATSLT